MDITKDIQSLTTFRRRSGDFMKQLKKSKRPVVLTVKGRQRLSCKTPKPISACSTLPRAPMQKKASVRAWRM